MASSGPRVVIVDYGMGNLRSVSKIVERARVDWCVSEDPVEVLRADRLILPGVGGFRDGMRNLRARGLDQALSEAVQLRRTPILGICLGMELMARDSEENGFDEGLGWLPASVRSLDKSYGLRIPHVGWNSVHQVAPNPLFEDVPDGATFYFVHSYVMHCEDDALVTASCEYGQVFSASVMMDNIFGCQFHPEKSQRYGGIIVHRFVLEELR